MPLNPGDLVQLKNTNRSDLHYNGDGIPGFGKDGFWDGIKGVVLEGPYTKAGSGEIQIYKILINDERLEPPTQEVEATWSALDKIGEGGDIEMWQAIKKWEKELDNE